MYAMRNPQVVKRSSKTAILSSTRAFQNSKLHSRPVIHNLGEIQVTYDAFYEDHKPIFNLLRTMGVMPLQRTATGKCNNTVWGQKLCEQ
jgi:hypothetical protein